MTRSAISAFIAVSRLSAAAVRVACLVRSMNSSVTNPGRNDHRHRALAVAQAKDKPLARASVVGPGEGRLEDQALLAHRPGDELERIAGARAPEGRLDDDDAALQQLT